MNPVSRRRSAGAVTGPSLDVAPQASASTQAPLGVAGAPEGRAELEATLSEVAEDTLELLKGVRALETALEDVRERLARVEQAALDISRVFAGELASLRQDLLGERKALAALSVFNGMAPVLDSLGAMRDGLASRKQLRTYRQVDAILETLSMMLRELGFSEFEAERGEPFDPRRMQCLDYGEGTPDTVAATARPGYQAGGVVVRPVGVVLGRQSPASPGAARLGRRGKKA